MHKVHLIYIMAEHENGNLKCSIFALLFLCSHEK